MVGVGGVIRVVSINLFFLFWIHTSKKVFYSYVISRAWLQLENSSAYTASFVGAEKEHVSSSTSSFAPRKS